MIDIVGSMVAANAEINDYGTVIVQVIFVTMPSSFSSIPKLPKQLFRVPVFLFLRGMR